MPEFAVSYLSRYAYVYHDIRDSGRSRINSNQKLFHVFPQWRAVVFRHQLRRLANYV